MDLGMPLHITVGSLMVSKNSVRVLNLDVLYVSIFKANKIQASQDFGISDKPIIAISTSYDSLGIAPSMPAGASVSLSPLLAALTISRLFGKDYANLPSRYELMIILTPSASLNYEATSRFVD